MSAMNEFQCPLTERIFPFVLRRQGFRKEAFARQQSHTAGRDSAAGTAGRKGTQLQGIDPGGGSRAGGSKVAAEAAEAKAAEEAAKKPQEPDPFVEAISGEDVCLIVC